MATSDADSKSIYSKNRASKYRFGFINSIHKGGKLNRLKNFIGQECQNDFILYLRHKTEIKCVNFMFLLSKYFF